MRRILVTGAGGFIGSHLVKKLKDKAKLRVVHLTEQDWDRFTEMFTYNTNAIEGGTITQSEVFDILSTNKWPHTKPKEDISETYGMAEAVKFIRKTKCKSGC